uniref:hypothetical protein n=1 Tax=Xanthomonas oryzae TaxID=347 RepID=UPI003EBF6C5D
MPCVVGGGLLAGEGALLARLLIHHRIVLLLRGQQLDVVAGSKCDAAALAGDGGRGQGEVVAGLHHDVAACAQLGAAHGFVGAGRGQ